jgi:uncharacterized membrane protein
MFVTCHEVWACILSIVISYTAILINIILLNMPMYELVLMFLIGIIVLIAFCIYEANVAHTFQSYTKFQETLTAKVDSENKEYLMKMETVEMRHMIGECAYHLSAL